MRKSYNRRNKNAARERMIAGLPLARSLLTLPGRDALCVSEMLAQRVINAETRQIWFENDPGEIPLIQASARRLGVYPKIMLSDIGDWTPTGPFDLINLDLEESLTPDNGMMLERLQESIPVDGNLLVTFAAHPRNRQPADFHDWMETEIANSAVLRSLAGTIRENIRDEVHIHNLSAASVSDIIVTMVLFSCCLRDRHITIPYYEWYDDGYPMIAVRATLAQPCCNPGLPSFSSLVEKWRPGYVPAKFVRRPHAPKREEVMKEVERKIEYERRWAKARATMARNELQTIDVELAILEQAINEKKLRRKTALEAIESHEAKAAAAERSLAAHRAASSHRAAG